MINLRRHRKNEGVDGTALHDLAMWISQSAHVGIGFVAGHNELNLVKATIIDCLREAFFSLTFEEVPDSLRKPVNTKI